MRLKLPTHARAWCGRIFPPRLSADLRGWPPRVCAANRASRADHRGCYHAGRQVDRSTGTQIRHHRAHRTLRAPTDAPPWTRACANGVLALLARDATLPPLCRWCHVCTTCDRGGARVCACTSLRPQTLAEHGASAIKPIAPIASPDTTMDTTAGVTQVTAAPAIAPSAAAHDPHKNDPVAWTPAPMVIRPLIT